MSIPRFRSLAGFLILFLFFASTASAWDLDSCGPDFGRDTGAAVAGCDVAAGGGAVANVDACGHCSHAGAHLLGVASGAASVHRADAVKVGRIVNLSPAPFHSSLFHPPRRTSALA